MEENRIEAMENEEIVDTYDDNEETAATVYVGRGGY